MTRLVTGFHAVSVLSAYLIYGILGLVGFVTGLVLMAMRKLDSESIILAVSSVAAFSAMILGSCTVIVAT